MNIYVFGKTMENVRKHRDISLVATNKKIIKLVLEPHSITQQMVFESLIVIEMKKIKVKMDKPIYPR